MRTDVFHTPLLAAAAASAAAAAAINSSTDIQPQHTALLNSMFPNFISDPKSTPAVNGYFNGSAAAAASMWNPYERPNELQAWQYETAALQRRLLEGRTAAAAAAAASSNINGYHPPMALSNLGSIVGPPSSLIPTSHCANPHVTPSPHGGTTPRNTNDTKPYSR